MQLKELGRYRILREQGQSATGPVFLAQDPQSAREVAIRLVQSFELLNESDRTEAVERFLVRVRSVSRVDHANILGVLDTGVHEGVPYLVTEQVEGFPLESYCSKDSLLPHGTVAELISGVAEGLDHAHRSGVVHGDIHPSALLRVDEVTAKIVGLGSRPGLQAGGQRELHGTPGYQSPEQIREQPIDGRADLFSLGAVLYEMLTGEKAFPGDSEATILYRSVNEEVRDPAELDPPVHPAIAAVVLRALAKQPENRFATGTEFAEALHSAGVAWRVDQSIEPTVERPAVQDPDVPADGVPARGLPPKRLPARSSARPFVLVGLLLIVTAGAVVYRSQQIAVPAPAAQPWLQAIVRTEPPGLEVELDGETLDPAAEGRIRFQGQEPFGVLTASLECRTAEHRLGPADAGTELVLVVDPVEVEIPVDPAVAGARVLVNGKSAGTTPTEVRLDLCRANQVEVRAAGYHPARIELPSGIGALEARKLAYALALERIPMGRLELPRQRGLQLVYYVDGKRLGKSVREVELEAGRHELRLKNEFHWIDLRRKIDVEDGKVARPGLGLSLASLVVQAFPSNCKVYLRKPGGKWRYLDETPAERRVATGDYEIKVELNPTGETRVLKVKLKESGNAPVRVAFGGGR